MTFRRAFLAPKKGINNINLKILEELAGASILYKSIDTIAKENEIVHYPIKYIF